MQEFRVRCGSSTGSYDLVVAVPNPEARSVAVSAVITVVGKYFCIVSAANQFGDSPSSNEVSFEAGAIPINPSGFAVQAQ